MAEEKATKALETGMGFVYSRTARMTKWLKGSKKWDKW